MAISFGKKLNNIILKIRILKNNELILKKVLIIKVIILIIDICNNLLKYRISLSIIVIPQYANTDSFTKINILS